jgi:hypothetical protein
MTDFNKSSDWIIAKQVILDVKRSIPQYYWMMSDKWKITPPSSSSLRQEMTHTDVILGHIIVTFVVKRSLRDQPNWTYSVTICRVESTTSIEMNIGQNIGHPQCNVQDVLFKIALKHFLSLPISPFHIPKKITTLINNKGKGLD